LIENGRQAALARKLHWDAIETLDRCRSAMRASARLTEVRSEGD
jgi:hypothetical protein